jgi:transcriptional regulator with XRE-family HTH domain
MANIRYEFVTRNFGTAIRQLRIEKGLTTYDFLYDLGINIARIERGKNDLSVCSLIAICCRLEIAPAKLIEKVEQLLILDLKLEESQNKNNKIWKESMVRGMQR